MSEQGCLGKATKNFAANVTEVTLGWFASICIGAIEDVMSYDSI